MPRGVQRSPWVWEAKDFTRVNAIRVTVTFDDATRVLSGATVFRDSACKYAHVYIGVGSGSGRPEDSPMTVPVPAGTTHVSAVELAALGLHTIENILAFQITAGP